MRAMLQERCAVLQARPYERCDSRLGRANGFKPKTLATRVGPIQFRIPQVRDGVSFYPSALEKGIRSERALMLSLAEMYVQGVSTRKLPKSSRNSAGIPSVLHWCALEKNSPPRHSKPPSSSLSTTSPASTSKAPDPHPLRATPSFAWVTGNPHKT